eukprot:SAG22_NODE_1667_length_3851_cov_1.673774_3_plen_144_part_00
MAPCKSNASLKLYCGQVCSVIEYRAAVRFSSIPIRLLVVSAMDAPMNPRPSTLWISTQNSTVLIARFAMDVTISGVIKRWHRMNSHRFSFRIRKGRPGMRQRKYCPVVAASSGGWPSTSRIDSVCHHRKSTGSASARWMTCCR